MDWLFLSIYVAVFTCALVGYSTQYWMKGDPAWECDHNFTGADPFDGCRWNESDWHWGETNVAAVTDPDPTGSGETVLRLYYPMGSYTGRVGDAIGGADFYARPFTAATHVILEYQVYFSPNFRWSLGGKLPGLHGGTGRCSGGVPISDCFSVRFIWTQEGYGELYVYNPMETDHPYCKNLDVSCNFDYGHTFGLRSFMFSVGTWETIALEIKLNPRDARNGTLRMYHEGEVVYHINNIKFRHDSHTLIDKIFFSTYFGGGAGKSPQYASEDNVYTYFRDFKIYTNKHTSITTGAHYK